MLQARGGERGLPFRVAAGVTALVKASGHTCLTSGCWRDQRCARWMVVPSGRRWAAAQGRQYFASLLGLIDGLGLMLMGLDSWVDRRPLPRILSIHGLGLWGYLATGQMKFGFDFNQLSIVIWPGVFY